MALSATVATLVFAVLVGLSAALVIRQPLFGFYSWTGYFWAWRLLRGPRAARRRGARRSGDGDLADRRPARTTASTTIAGLIVVFLINVGVAGTLTWFGWIGNEQQQRRAGRSAALTEANAKLEESLRHNADLQEQLLTQAREAGVSEERRRMAREIHDTLAQGLMGIITQLQAAQRAGVASDGRRPPSRPGDRPRARQPDRGAPVGAGARAPSRSRRRGCPTPSKTSRGAGRTCTASRCRSRRPARPA